MRNRARLRVVAVFVGVALIGAAHADGAVCAAAAKSEFISPVDGPILRRFEAPLGPYASGHRGIDYEVPEGTAVVASGDGVVKFAGPVADDGLFITIKHGEVLETIYSFLSQIAVQTGQEVKQGEVIGASGPGHPGEGVPALHFGAKAAGQYIDPEILLFGNLDDISNLISLAPFEDEGEFTQASGGSAHLKPIELSKISPSEGLFPKIGGGLIGAARAVREAPGKAWSWITSRVKGVIDLSKGAWQGITNGLGAAWDRTASFASEVGKGATSLLRKVGGLLSSVAKSVGGFLAATWKLSLKVLKAGLRWIRVALGAVFKSVKNAARLIKSVGKAGVRRILLLKNLVVFAYGMIGGAIEQVECQRAGGATPPKIPSKEELAAGAKAPPPPNDNIVIAVAGIGSSTEELSDGTIDPHASMYEMDLRTLGYREDQIYHFSYRGIEERPDGGPYRLHAPYSSEETFQPIEDSAELLRRQIETIQAQFPDKQVDLVAHSQGGLVARYFIQELYDTTDDERAKISHFVSIGTPHHGADAASIHDSLNDNLQGRIYLAELGVVANVTGLPPPSSPAAREMAESSDFIANLDRNWDPSKVRTTSIAATFDLVVTSSHTRLEGADNFTSDLPGLSLWQHGKLVHAPDTKGIMYNALSDRPSECTALRNAFADYGLGRLISEIEGAALEIVDVTSELLSPIGQVP